MKNLKFTLLALIILLGTYCQNNNSNFDFADVVGEYRVYKTELVEEYSDGWNYSKRYERTLFLMSDSTYKEINVLFETFDMVDYYGTWCICNNIIYLTPKGYLDYENGDWIPKEKTNNDTMDLKFPN